MNWISLLGLFAKPLGAAINNGLTAASGAVLAWALTKGADASIVTPIIAGTVNVISLAISGLAATQGVQIPIINKDATNGVMVVSSYDAGAKSIQAVNGPKA